LGPPKGHEQPSHKTGHKQLPSTHIYPGNPTTIKTMGVNITTIAYLRVLVIEIGSTIILMVVEAQGLAMYRSGFNVLYCQAYMGR